MCAALKDDLTDLTDLGDLGDFEVGVRCPEGRFKRFDRFGRFEVKCALP